jgi:hypothetical protein
MLKLLPDVTWLLAALFPTAQLAPMCMRRCGAGRVSDPQARAARGRQVVSSVASPTTCRTSAAKQGRCGGPVLLLAVAACLGGGQEVVGRAGGKAMSGGGKWNAAATPGTRTLSSSSSRARRVCEA